MNFSRVQTDVGSRRTRSALSGYGLSRIEDATSPPSYPPQNACAVKSTVLHSWKEIAAYMCRGVRTVQRWESLGLPVHRPLGKSRSAVLAFSEELDCWLQQTPIQSKANCDSGDDLHTLLELSQHVHGVHKALLANKQRQTPKVQELVKRLEQTVTELRFLINAATVAEVGQTLALYKAMQRKQANAV